MKALGILTITLFAAVMAVPVLAFNFEEGAVSLIDNRELAANPFSEESLNEGGDLSDKIENYVRDRIGFRDDMILAYTVGNDMLFHKMVHPSYMYGRDGYVFGAGVTVNGNSPSAEYCNAFADMVSQIQEYCDARGVPFLFAFNPAKPAVLTDRLPVGINYDRTWVNTFLAALDERGVRYVDNTPLLRERTEAGETVFNQKYDANHWNDWGAYYGTNAMLRELKRYLPKVHVNSPEELTVTETLQTSLPVSKFPIHENVPSVSVDMDLNTDRTAAYAEELYRHPSFGGFGYYINEKRMKEGAPRALVFQGSYMNGFGWKYLANGFGEYIHVHDYQNVIDFPYYFNIFQPDCVIFEVAEYTFNSQYFDYDNMLAMDLNPVLRAAAGKADVQKKQKPEADDLSAERGKVLTTIRWAGGPADYAWLTADREYDMKKTEGGYEVTVPTQIYDRYKDEIQITVSSGDVIEVYMR